MSLLLLFNDTSDGPVIPPDLIEFFADCPKEDYSVSLRKALYDFIILARDNNMFKDANDVPINDFDVEESYLPFEELVKLNKDSPNGKLYISQSPTDETIASRAALANTEAGILFAFQKGKVRNSDIVAIDNLVNLVGQFKYIARKFEQETAYCWNRTEAMKDENGTPYAYLMLKQSNIFQTYFMTYYTYFAV